MQCPGVLEFMLPQQLPVSVIVRVSDPVQDALVPGCQVTCVAFSSSKALLAHFRGSPPFRIAPGGLHS